MNTPTVDQSRASRKAVQTVIRQHKNARGHKLPRFTAVLVTTTGGTIDHGLEADTPEQAVELLAREIDRGEEFRLRRRYIFTGNGTTFCLYYAAGWCYDIADAGRARPCSCYMARDSYDEALASMRRHAEQGFGGIVGEC